MESHIRDLFLSGQNPSTKLIKENQFHKKPIRFFTGDPDLAKKTVFFAGLLFLCLFFQSCAAVPFATEGLIERKISKLPLQTPKNEAFRQFGTPHYMVTIFKDGDIFEFAGYEMGNYAYSETSLLIFKNGYLTALPASYYEVFQFMTLSRLVGRTEFWRLDQVRSARQKNN